MAAAVQTDEITPIMEDSWTDCMPVLILPQTQLLYCLCLVFRLPPCLASGDSTANNSVDDKVSKSSPYYLGRLSCWYCWWTSQSLFVACSTNAGEGLVKLSHVVWRTWMCGGVAHSFCAVVKWLSESQGMQPRLSDVERSVVLRSMFAIGSALTYLWVFRECATPPHVQVRHTTWLSFTRRSPALQAKNTGARRPGYEAKGNHSVVKMTNQFLQWQGSL